MITKGTKTDTLLKGKLTVGQTHKVGKHGAIGWVTQQGLYCVECKKKIKEEVCPPTTKSE